MKCISVLDVYEFLFIDGYDVCFLCEAPVDVRFEPCGHARMCHDCGARAKKCPTCKVYADCCKFNRNKAMFAYLTKSVWMVNIRTFHLYHLENTIQGGYMYVTFLALCFIRESVDWMAPARAWCVYIGKPAKLP